jgi:signal transduction histidine kinase
LAGGIAHDFNNLIMRVLGNVALIRMDLASVLPAQSANLLDEHLEQIDAAGQCATDLSRQLLAYAGKSSLALERTSLSQLVVQSLPLIHLAVRGVAKVQLQLVDQLPSIIADVTQLRQVLLNLVINAAEAISPSVVSVESHVPAVTGSVLIATSLVQVSEQQLRSAHAAPDATPGPHAVLQITDDGVGMDSSHAEPDLRAVFYHQGGGAGPGAVGCAGHRAWSSRRAAGR